MTSFGGLGGVLSELSGEGSQLDPFSLGLLYQRIAQGDPEAIAHATQQGITPGDITRGPVLGPEDMARRFGDQMTVPGSSQPFMLPFSGEGPGLNVPGSGQPLNITGPFGLQPGPPDSGTFTSGDSSTAPPETFLPPNGPQRPKTRPPGARWPQVRVPESPRPFFHGGVAGAQKAPDFGGKPGLTPAMALLQALMNARPQTRSRAGGGQSLGAFLGANA